MDVIIYPRPNPDADLGYLCYVKAPGPLWPFNLHELTLIPAWISNNMSSKSGIK